MRELSPVDEARVEVVEAVLTWTEGGRESESALEMIDLAAVRLVAELEAEHES